VECETINK